MRGRNRPASARDRRCPTSRRATRLIFAGILTAVILSYVGPVRAYLAQRAELAQESARLEVLEDRRETLQRQVRASDRAQFIERRARDLGLVRDGERAFLIQGLDEIERRADEERRAEQADAGGGGVLGWLPGI